MAQKKRQQDKKTNTMIDRYIQNTTQKNKN